MAKFKKLGGGSFRLTTKKSGKVIERIIKPGQIFVAALEDIPVAFRDMVEEIKTEEKPKAKAKK